MKNTEHYRLCAEVFGLDVPLTQSQPTDSTQGMHRTPSVPRSPNPKMDTAESSAPKRSTVICFCLPERRSTRLTPPAPVPTVDKADEMISQDTLQWMPLEEYAARLLAQQQGLRTYIAELCIAKDDEHHVLNIFHLHNDSLEPVCKLKKVYMIKVFYKGYSTFEANPFVPIDVLGSMVHVLMLDTLSKRCHGWSSVMEWYAIVCGWYSLRSCGALCHRTCGMLLAELRDCEACAPCGATVYCMVRESSKLFIFLYLSRSMGDVDTCLHLSLLGRGPTPCCLLKKFDSLKSWNDHFFWINASICPISVPWHAGAYVLKDPLPSDNCVNVELLALLDRHRTVIGRYLETFLCLIGLSRSFDDIHVHMGLFDFVKFADLFKVKTGERMLAEGEVPLNDETHAGKKKKRVVFYDLPAKRLRTDAAVATEAMPTTGGKSPTALKRLELQSGPQGVGSSSVPPFAEEFVSSSITTTPEPDVPEDSGSTQDGGVRTHHASMGIIVYSDDDVASPRAEPLAGAGDLAAASAGGTVETATADNIYVPEWGVTNGAQIDNPAIFRNLLDHVTPPGYWAALRNQSAAGFLDAFNINYAQHTYMVSELRLRYEHEIMTRENFQKKFTDNCVVVQQCDVEIADLKNRLEKAEREATKVSAFDFERGELNRHIIKLGVDCECLRHEVAGESKLRDEFKSFQDAAERNFAERANALDARIADVRRDMDNDLYPHMLTAIAGRRWVVWHGFRLAVYKCARSVEFHSALGKVISMAINKGIQQGLEVGVVHDGAGRSLSQIEAYDPDTKGKYVVAVSKLENVSFPLLDELEILKDSPLALIMYALALKDDDGNTDSTHEFRRRGLCPPSTSTLGLVSGFVPPHGSSLGVADYQVLTFVLFGNGVLANQPPVVQAHDDLFDTSVLDGACVDGNHRELSGEEVWETIENFAQGQKEWDNPPNITSEQEVANLKAQAKRLFGNDDVLVEMHRGIAWDKVGNSDPQSTPQVLPSFEEYTPPVTFSEEVEKTLGTPIEMFDDDWGLESKEVSPLGEELSLFDRPNEVERGRILEAHRLEPTLQQQISQCMAPSHHDGMNEKDKKRGVEYVMSKILGFYKECLELGPEYLRGMDDEGEVTLYLMRRSLEDLRMLS
ncbi:hypothetical protein Tco_0653534 [Tanacetum coccineum]|uniref:Uncharacterized protein n=1 Tax=Tanacetum coccineum TaxID=301880 RepID=A0ABQ4X1F8_9ASTR